MAKTKRATTLVLRFMAFGATLAATIVMATSHQTVDVFATIFSAKYTVSPAFKYFVIANAIVSAYGLLVPFIPAESKLWRSVFALDMVFTMLLISSFSAALAIAYVGKKGNAQAGWFAICGQVPVFCDHVTGALIASVIGFIIYMSLLLHTIHTVLNPLLVGGLG
ncbi:DUF588 domain-containing protein [Cephalotus follicularis]|uniref:CASP-like protein n=1 Tax=Cephalotus follicularis TaxID=3775 RepID=A0A1Q3BRE3_CEPFO|nr:DUF588 domain-containing protein [Cephalotus follicularis]